MPGCDAERDESGAGRRKGGSEMKVRARVKGQQYLPERTRCCDAPLTKQAESMEFFMVDTSRRRSGEGTCTACGAPQGEITQVIGWFPAEEWIDIDIIDLDEGPIDIPYGDTTPPLA